MSWDSSPAAQWGGQQVQLLLVWDGDRGTLSLSYLPSEIRKTGSRGPQQNKKIEIVSWTFELARSPTPGSARERGVVDGLIAFGYRDICFENFFCGKENILHLSWGGGHFLRRSRTAVCQSPLPDAPLPTSSRLFWFIWRTIIHFGCCNKHWFHLIRSVISTWGLRGKQNSVPTKCHKDLCSWQRANHLRNYCSWRQPATF